MLWADRGSRAGSGLGDLRQLLEQSCLSNTGGAMQVVFLLISMLAFLAGLAVMAGAAGAIHEILAGVAFLIWAVFFTGAGIIGAVNRLSNQLKSNSG